MKPIYCHKRYLCKEFCKEGCNTDIIFEDAEKYSQSLSAAEKKQYEKKDYYSNGCCDFDPNIIGKIIGKLKGELD